uniref:Uncharacterized protein n=1 Tax=Arundo donax TaxID=35708 RepID=A0A0A9C1Q5_ARUDO
MITASHLFIVNSSVITTIADRVTSSPLTARQACSICSCV